MYNEFDEGAGKNSLFGLAIGSYHKVILRFQISLSSARRQPFSIYCFISRNILQALPTIFQRRVVVSTVGSTAQLPVSILVCHIISSTALYFNRALRRRNFLRKQL